ncbi:MAG: hypothetical protein HRU12_17715 [Phaeodactylibacter sp.]|nr:hypothetical protein [Phaeodactylibacter sp.]
MASCIAASKQAPYPSNPEDFIQNFYGGELRFIGDWGYDPIPTNNTTIEQSPAYQAVEEAQDAQKSRRTTQFVILGAMSLALGALAYFIFSE